MKLRWPKLPSPWLALECLRVLHSIMAVACVGLAIYSGPSWSGVVDGFIAGFNVGIAIGIAMQIRRQKHFDGLVTAFNEMSSLNRALIENKVIMMMEQPNDDSPPLAPRLH